LEPLCTLQFRHNFSVNFLFTPILKKDLQVPEKLNPDEARRHNAQKSTGPKTDEGKKISSQNAVKHGVHAADIIINSPHLREQQSEYDQLVESLFDELKPKGDFQEHLVHKIAQCIWRHRRVINAEAAAVNKQVDSESDRCEARNRLADKINIPGLSRRDINWIIANAIPDDSNDSPDFLRYEWRLDRQLSAAYRLLRLHQLTTPPNSLQNLLSK
jgi:hypothetical protein